jgi:ABC-type transporter Mla maintaining outer membrane lipid asymmetry ATPase subunit MlaF
MTPILQLKNIHIQFDSQVLFHQLNLSVMAGQICCIRTGLLDGGSTLLRCCAGLVQLTEGEVWLEGRNIEQYSDTELFKRISYCQEQQGLLSIFSNYNNIVLPISYHFDIDKHSLHEQIIRLAEKFNLSQYLHKEPQQLNDVQLGLMTLLRALVIGADIILLDEFQAGMSVEMRDTVLKHILAEKEKHGFTLLMTVTAGDDVSFADRVFQISEKQLKEELL